MKFRALWLAVGLGGCGFHPLYSSPATSDTVLGAVYVDIIPNRNGQILRQALQARLDGPGTAAAKTYVLSVALSQSGEQLSYNGDNTNSRERDIQSADWSLHTVDSPFKRIAHGTARAVDGHDILDAQFFYADLQSEAATRRMAESVADQITQALAVYFRKHPART